MRTASSEANLFKSFGKLFLEVLKVFLILIYSLLIEEIYFGFSTKLSP